MKKYFIITLIFLNLFLFKKNKLVFAATPECYLSGGGIGGDLQEGIANYGVVGNTAHLFAGIWADNSLVSNSWLFDGETWVEVNHTGDQYNAELNFDKIYDHTGDYNLASYWRFTDGSDLLCTGGLIKVYYKDIVNLGIKELTYSSSIFPNRGTSNIYFNGSHQYVGFIRLYLDNVSGNNTAIPINSTTWELRVNDQLTQAYSYAAGIGEWGYYWLSYEVTLPDVNQVEISLVTPAFNAGEGNGSFASFNTFDNILVLSRDTNDTDPPPPPPSTPCTSVSGYVRQIGTNEGIYGAQVTPQRYLDSVLYGCTTATTNLTGYWSSYCNGDMDILRVIKNASLPTGCVAATTLATAPPGFNCDSPDIGYNHIFCTKNASWTTSCGPFTFWVDCDENYVAPSPTPTPTPTPAPCPVCSSITTEVGASYGLNNNYKIDGYVYFTPTLTGYDAGTRAYVDRVDINAFTSAARTVTCKITDASGNNDQGLIEATSPTFVSQSWVPITFAAGNQYTVTLGQAARLFCHGPASEAYTTIQWFYNNVLQGAVPPNGNGGNHIIRCCPIEPVINAPWFQTIAGSVMALGSTGIRSNIPYHDASGPCIAANSCKPALISSLPYVYTAAAQNTPGFALSKYGAITTHQDSANQTTLIHDTERSQTLDGYALDASLRVRLQNYDHFIKKFAPNDLIVLNSSTMPSLQTDNLNLFIYDGDLSINDTHNWHVEDGQQVIVFVNGNLTINALNNFEGNVISVEEGSFLAFIVKQNITIGKEVGYTLANGLTAGEYLPSTTTPNLEGVFVADQLLISESYNDTAIVDKKLIAAGTFVGWAGINLNRDFNDEALGLEHNSYNPTETFIYRPDLVTNMPEEIKSFHQMWQEVAPRRLESD